MSRFDTLDAKEQQAIIALCSCDTIIEAAKQCRISKATIFRWLERPDFAAAYRDVRYQVLREATALLQKACTRAAQAVLQVMEDEDTAPSLKLEAAKMVFDMAMKAHGMEELEERILALESPDDTSAAEAA